MTADERIEHLLSCRSIYGQLIELEFQRVQAPHHSAMHLPFNLPVLLRQFESYIRWAARHANVIEMPVGTPNPLDKEGGNTA